MPTRPPGTPDIDLTFDNTFGILNGAVFMTGLDQPAGTGAFNSFVQIQHTGTEQGYNTDASAQYDEKSSHNHNHSVLLADVPIVVGDGSNGTIDGVTYREFLLDLNEPNGNTKPYISLDALQIWQEEAGNLTNFTPGSGFAGAHTNYLAYNLDAGGNHWIALNDGLSHGTGQSDVRILIPDSFFINDASHRYVTLYSEFGAQNGWDSRRRFRGMGPARRERRRDVGAFDPQDRDGPGRHRRRRRRGDRLCDLGLEHRQHGADRHHGHRSVGEQSGGGSERRVQHRRYQSRQSAQRRRDVAVHRKPHRDAGRHRLRWRRRRRHQQHGDRRQHSDQPGFGFRLRGG